MPPKKIFSSNEEAIAYIEEIRQKNRDRAKKHYNETIKSSPENYQKFLDKCKRASNTFYHKNKTISV